MSASEAIVPTDLAPPERAHRLLPKLTDKQLATLRSYGVTERTSVGQVLATAGDPAYDLMVVLEGEVECSDIHDGRRRPLLVHGPRDFIAELDILTGQRLYATFVVTQAGSIIRVPRTEVKSRPLSPRDQPAGCVRSRRRPGELGQACRGRGGRRQHGRSLRPAVPR